MFAVLVVGFYFILVQGEQFNMNISTNTALFLTAFSAIGIIKILLTIYVVLQWLNEYYEITPDAIIHKKGIIFKHIERYGINMVRSMHIHDTFLGEIFNFATVTLYDIRLNKYFDMYHIHNPRRYTEALKALRPQIEIKTEHTRLPFLPKEDAD